SSSVHPTRRLSVASRYILTYRSFHSSRRLSGPNMQRPWLILLSAASSFSIVVAASGLGGAPVACRTPDRDRSRRLTARENLEENLRRRNIVRWASAASALRPDDRKRGQACGTR